MPIEPRPVTLAAIRAAHPAIRAIARATPLMTSVTMEAMLGVPLFLKAENFQKTGSFKIRGAYHTLSRLARRCPATGVVTASAGNHAQGVALAARMVGLPATVFMPAQASIAKVQATRGYGADVRLGGATFDDAVASAQGWAEETGATFVPAFDHDDIITGQGTVALEILEALPEVGTVVVPVGGGGLIGGMAVALKQTRANIRVVGVQAEGAPAMARSFGRQALEPTASVATIADGIAIKHPALRTFRLIERYVDEMVTVADEDIARTIVMLLERQKMVVEGAGAVALTALLTGKVRPVGPTVAVISGGNIDTKLLSTLIERQMMRAGRYARLFTAVPDRPGGLAALLAAIAELGGNLIELHHLRISSDIPLGMTGVEIKLETRDEAHILEIAEHLRAMGTPVRVMP